MASMQGFNADEVEPDVGFAPIPAGKYACVIVASESKPTKAGTGHYYKFTLEVCDGEYKGRKLWWQVNYDNPSAEATAIGRAQLSSICRAVDVRQPEDTSELHNIPLTVSVSVKQYQGEDQNEIKGCEPISGSKPAPSNTPAGGGKVPPAKGFDANSSKPVWER